MWSIVSGSPETNKRLSIMFFISSIINKRA
jgi:hypothetical protein